MYYKDYPIEGNESSDLIAIELLAYDRNKYVTVKYKELIDSIKSGYIYKLVEGDKKFLSKNDVFSLPVEVGEGRPSRKDIANELKSSRHKKTSYNVWIDGKREEFDTILSAVNFVRNRIKHTVHDVEITRQVKNKNFWTNETIVEICGIYVHDYVSRKNSARCSGFLSKKHFRVLQKLAQQRKI